MKSVKLRSLVLALGLAVSSVAPVLAQDITPMVLVPEHPGGGVPVEGCFRANENLFGPYRLTFCLERRGTYEVRGGGIRCDGRLTGRTSGRDILIDLQRASCGRGRAWEEASIDCRHFGSLLGRALGRLILGDTPRLSALRCTYHPTVRGVSSRTFTANRR